MKEQIQPPHLHNTTLLAYMQQSKGSSLFGMLSTVPNKTIQVGCWLHQLLDNHE
jgi:hypothetical protein